MSSDQQEREASATPEALASVKTEIDSEIMARMRGYTPVAVTPNESTVQTSPELTTAVDQKAFEGKIVKHGAAPYLDDDKNSASYYVTLKDKAGQEHTHWGVGLKDALSGFKRGQEVSLNLKESEPVQVKVRDESGHVTTRDAIRNVWEATRLDGPQPKAKVSKEPADKEVTHGFRTANFDSNEPDLA
jgi:hypothetical protein